MNNSIFGMWSDLADFNNPGNPYYQSFDDRFVVGWYGVDELGTANKFTYEITLFSNNDFSINYGSFDYLGPTGRTFTSGFQGDQAGESYQIYYGNNPSGLQNTTFLVQSSEVVPMPEPEPEQPIAPDCNINPTDPSCIINSIIDDQEETYFADENSGFDDGSDDGSSVFEEEEEQDIAIEEETFVAAEDSIEEETFTEEPETLEEMLADESVDEMEDDLLEEAVVAREINDEQKSSALADSIATNVLEAALAIAADATSAAGGSGESSSQSSSSSNKETIMASSISDAAQDSSSVSSSTSDSTDSSGFDSSSGDAALDILETGRAMGQEALVATMSMTEMAAIESMTEAESIAAESSTESLVASAASVIETATVAVVETQEQQSVELESSSSESSSQQQTESNNETFVADSSAEQIQEMISFEAEQVVESTVNQQSEETIIETQTEEVVVADTVVIESVDETQDTSMMVENTQEEQQSAVEFTTVEQTMEMFAENINSQVQSEQEELENNIIQQAIASSQQSEENNSMGFAEAEAVTIVNDPALANAFNVQPNTASLELLGVLGSAGQDKSDAELRAEQVVAANKEEQDAINANYMEADQSGILAAIGSETDVSAYRTAMLRDNNVWYKPEDIYKGVIIKDNVRGSYFLEKGNTDTYKKMIEEQYKDE
jgi:hypothetical protein